MNAPAVRRPVPAAPAAPMAWERPRRIHFADCDPAGIVYFPQYLVMFNVLVEDFVTEALGISYAALITDRRIGLPIVSLGCEFSAVSRLGDEVMLGVSVEHIGGASLTLQFGCRAGPEWRVRSRQVLVTTDLATHRARPIPTDLREALAAFAPTP